MTGREPPVIRTPDQRIRVFVSSTLRELAEERAAVRAAVERLRMAPVMFELGARPHPPRELYRSYLAQSDVFIGVYADSYGWVAPGEEISGLEDEYRLAPREMPKLIYIKESANREERLTELIGRIRDDDTAAYLTFRSVEELGERVAADLATLLAERFDQSRAAPAVIDQTPENRLPVPYTATIGRDDDIARVRELLRAGPDRVITIVGPGGIGKSRLAIEVAHASAESYPDGVVFVPLEGVLEAGLLLPTIAYALGVRDSGDVDLEARIAHAMSGRRALLVLDNFEQIVDAAPTLVRLYTAAPLVSFLVTSRVVLRIRGERVYDLAPLSAPGEAEPATLTRARGSSAVALFVDRAQAVDPAFALTPANAAAVIDICRRLDGLPLAIELAAAKVRMLTPAAIADRLERTLPLLTAASRDLPDRHRTMTGAIEWSVGLLPGVQRELLEDLGVFATRFGLDAVEDVCAHRPWSAEALDALSGLVDASLVNRVPGSSRPAYSLLATVREFALGRLKAQGRADEMRRAHADHYLALVREIAPSLRGPGQPDAVHRLGLELPNLRAAARHLVYCDRLEDAGDFAWSLFPYWWISGFFSEVRLWMLEVLERGHPISDRTRAIAVFFTSWGDMWRRPSADVIDGLAEAQRLFELSGDEDAAAMAIAARGVSRLRFPDLDVAAAAAEMTEGVARLEAVGDWWSVAAAETGLGLLTMAGGSLPAAMEHFERSLAIGVERQDAFTRVLGGNNVARVRFHTGDVPGAAEEYRTVLALSAELGFDEGCQYALEGMSAIAAVRGDAWRAGVFSAAAEAVEQRIGLFDVEGYAVHLQVLAQAREVDPDAVAAGERAGAEMTLAEACALALAE